MKAIGHSIDNFILLKKSLKDIPSKHNVSIWKTAIKLQFFLIEYIEPP